MKNYTPLHCHSHYSLLDGLSKPEKIAKRIHDLGIERCALTDHGTISGSVAYANAMTGYKEKVDGVETKFPKHPILGCELYVSTEHASIQAPENQKLLHLPVLAKNLAGWRKLIKLTSTSNAPEHFYHKPRLSLDQIAAFADGNLIAFSGHLGSHLASCILADGKPKDNWLKQGCKLAEWFEDTFGRGNFWIESQRMDGIKTPLQLTVSDCMRRISQQTGIPLIATPDAHYAAKEDAIDQRILLCQNLKTTLTEAYEGKVKTLSCFFNSDNFHIPSYDEMISYGHTEEELENTMALASSIEDYKITGPPILPEFDCPGGVNSDEWLRELCRRGFRKKVVDRGLDFDKYGKQTAHELEVFEEAGLPPYFLIVQDMLDYCSRNGWLVGPGRGSAAGCLVSYLIGITQIDPVPYDLWFERFYNAGRNTGGRVSMPDIDIDVPVGKREAVINYLKDKYGKDKVSQMITFQTMKGSGSLKAVLRAHGGVPFEVMNRMTENLPEESKISGELQAMKEATGESSIIMWALENRPKKFSEWVTLEDDGSLSGPYARRFEQAIRLEGTKSAQSKHAAGVVIAPEPLGDICPMVLDTKSRNMVAGLEMFDLESIGMIKFDILGVAMLDKVMGVQQILKTGDIQ